MGIRPIVSSCSSITETIIIPICWSMITTTCQNLPSYLKDTTEFLKLIETTKLPSKCTLASIDVSSLYTNIPHDDGKQSVLYFLQNNSDNYLWPEQPLSEVLTELIDIVLRITYSNSIVTIIYRSKELQWVLKRHPHMQTYSWES